MNVLNLILKFVQYAQGWVVEVYARGTVEGSEDNVDVLMLRGVKLYATRADAAQDVGALLDATGGAYGSEADLVAEVSSTGAPLNGPLDGPGESATLTYTPPVPPG